jgi:hypothetical protein
VALNHRRVPGPAELEASWTPVRLSDGGVYPYGFGWMLEPQRGQRRIGHTGSWQGFKTSIQRYPEFDLTVIALANLAEAHPAPISYAIAGILEPALLPAPLAGALPGHDRPREPIATLLRRLASGSDSAGITPGFRRFTTNRSRAELGRELDQAGQWSPIGCERPSSRFDYLDARVAFICYARTTTVDGRKVATVYYDAKWRAAGVDLELF